MSVLNNLCAITVTPADSVFVLLIGMLVIFAVLTVIIFVVKGYVGVFKLLDKCKSKKESKKVATPAPVVEETAPVAVQSDDELIAVITAAIAAVYAQSSDDGEVPPFRVKSILLK